jgi:hypothetical protein
MQGKSHTGAQRKAALAGARTVSRRDGGRVARLGQLVGAAHRDVLAGLRVDRALDLARVDGDKHASQVHLLLHLLLLVGDEGLLGLLQHAQRPVPANARGGECGECGECVALESNGVGWDSASSRRVRRRTSTPRCRRW